MLCPQIKKCAVEENLSACMNYSLKFSAAKAKGKGIMSSICIFLSINDFFLNKVHRKQTILYG